MSGPAAPVAGTGTGTGTGTGFVVLIPARLASTRLPDKPLADIGGQAMVVRVAARAAAAGAQLVAVATDAPAIREAVEAAGFRAVMTRSDHPSGTDRLAEAATLLGLADDAIIVNVQGDEPLIDPALISAVARALQDSPDCAMATAAAPVADPGDLENPNVVKVVLDQARRALYFSRAAIPLQRDRHVPRAETALRHIGLYAYRGAFLREFPRLSIAPLEAIEMLEQLRVLWHGHRIAVHVSNAPAAPGVDTREDLERVRAAWRHESAAAADQNRPKDR